MSEAEKLAQRIWYEWPGDSAGVEMLLPLCSALLMAREALAGNLDQPETPESYDAMMERTTVSLAAIDALLKAEK